MFPTNFHAFEVFYVGPTDHLGSRTKIVSKRFKQSVTLPYDHEFNGSREQAIAYLEGKGFVITGQAEFSPSSTLLLSSTFKPLKGE